MLHDASAEECAELAALYALGALPDAEWSVFDSHLASGCAACATEFQRVSPVAAALLTPVPAVAPPAPVRAALLERVSHAASHPSPLRMHVLAEMGKYESPSETILHRAAEGPWQDTTVPGVRLRVLSVDRGRNQFSALVRMAPGAAYPRHVHSGPEECLVLEGELRVGDALMRAGDYQHARDGSAHDVQCTATGCLLFITSSLSDDFG